MRKILPLLFLIISVQVFAQTYPITGINISLPANPDANTANWGNGTSLFTITANSKAANGRVDGHVAESKILVTIKKGGAKVCGSFTANSAPASNFNTLTKVWSGSNAVSLLGQGCVLPSGEYEICVQFFGYGAASPAPLSEEKCKTFSIRAKEQLSYQQPQAIAPANGAILSEIDIKKPLTFRWTPLVPRPQEPVTYRLKVWQLMQGQNGAQAMAANQPIITKDVDNLTQTVITNLISGPCKPPYLCDFIWNVQALNREGKPVGGNNGMSESAQFSANSCDVNLIMKLQSVECLPATQGNNNYKICMSATYNSSTYNLTYANAGSGFKAYNPSYSPFYGISNITPALQVQNNGAATTVNYCFDVIVPVGQTAIKVGLQGDDKDPGPIVCQPGAELDVQLPICDVGCKCGSWNPLTVQTSAGAKRYDCGSTIPWSCKEPFKFTSSYQCKPNTDNCKAKVRWTITKDGSPYSSGTGATSTFTPTANGTYKITLDADCNDVKCTPCIYTIVVKDCRPDITCDCSNDMYVIAKPGEFKIRCKDTKIFDYGTVITLVPENICNPAKCLSEWNIRVYDLQTGAFVTSGSGSGINSSFEFTLNSLAGYRIEVTGNCNGKKCVCTFYIRTNDIVQRCSCGTWNPITVQTAGGAKRYDCGSTIPWSCKTPFQFTSSYQCSPNDKTCEAKTTWEVKKGTTVIKSGTGTNQLNDGFSLLENGTYTLTLNASCNDKECKPCTYTIEVEDCILTCECNKEMYVTAKTKLEKIKIACKDTNIFDYGAVITLVPENICNPAKCLSEWNIRVYDLQTGAFVTSGSGSGINSSFEFTLNSLAGYRIEVTGNCNGKKCVCTFYIRTNDIGKGCICGKWNPLVVQTDAGAKRYECGGEKILWSCKTPFKFTSSYECNPNTDNCKAKVRWTITKDGSPYSSGTGAVGAFTPTANGTYTITLDADCNGVKCPPCTYTIVVKDCPPCDCGEWGKLVVQNAAVILRYDCGKEIGWKCNQDFKFTNTYACKTNDATCAAKTKWNVTRNGQSVGSGTGLNGGFKPTENGVYVITLTAECNGKPCPSCIYTVVVKDCPPCDCGSWGTLLVNKVKYECGNEKPIKWNCNKPIDFSNTYQCSPNDKTCQAKTKWEVTKDGQNFSSGSGSNGTFTPTANGTYTLTLHANCYGKDCKDCVTTFIVDDCETCDCGKWGSLVVPTLTGNKTYQCGIKMLIPWSCKQPFNFSDTYQCSPNDRTCQANTTWKVEKDNNLINSGTGTNTLNGTFTPTENGIYTITLEASCNGVKCKPCIYQVNVTDCCQTSKIIIKKKNTTIPNDGSCLKPGDYSFNLNITPSTPTVSGTYVLTAMPNNVPPVSSGSFTSGTPINLTIPEYVCGSVTGFKLTYTWNHAKCSSTIERAICPPPCCDNITLKKTNKLLTGTDLDFTTQFSILPSATFTKVKVQILDINVSGAAKPWANILSLNESTWGAGTTNSAITTPGNAIWFSGSLLANGPLTFSGKIINIFGMATTNTVNLVLRFTFYQNNGSCSEIICEKDISFNNGIGPKQSDK